MFINLETISDKVCGMSYEYFKCVIWK